MSKRVGYVQQQHVACSGHLVVCAGPNKEFGVACNRCKALWTIDVPAFGDSLKTVLCEEWGDANLEDYA